MRRRSLRSLLVLILFAGACGERAGGRAGSADDGTWESVEVIHGPDVHVRLRHRKRASVVDEQWLGLEFVNTTSEPIELRGLQLHFDYDLVGRAGGGLLSSNTPSVLPPPWSSLWQEPVALAPGTTLLWGGLSAVASARLPLATSAEGSRLRLHVGGHVQVGDGGTPHDTPDGGVWVQMTWLPVDDAGISALRKRLDRLLDAPRDSTAPVDRIASWLRKPRVCSHLDANRLLGALDRRRPDGVARKALARYLAVHFGDAPVVQRHFLVRLQAGDLDALGDLVAGQSPSLYSAFSAQPAILIWMPEYVEAIARLVEKTPRAWRRGFLLLEAHGTPQAKDHALAQRLSAAVLAQRVLEDPERHPDGFMFLARCRDASMLPRLVQRLADISVRRSIAGYPLHWSFTGFRPNYGERPPPSRVCDFALDAILTLEGRSLSEEYKRAGFADLGLWNTQAADEDNVRKIGAMRDRMIAELQLRLRR